MSSFHFEKKKKINKVLEFNVICFPGFKTSTTLFSPKDVIKGECAQGAKEQVCLYL